MDDFDRELKLGFLEEAEQGIADVEQCFLALEQNPSDQENLNKVFRLAHNLKGSSKAVGFDEFGAFTHQFESFILKVKNGQLSASARAVSLMLRCSDHIVEIIHGLRADLAATFDSTGLLAEMSSFTEGDVESTAPVLVDSEVSSEAPQQESIEAFDQAMAASAKETEELSKPTSPSPLTVPTPPSVSAPKVLPATPTESPLAKAPPVHVDESIRVALSKVESLVNYVGEMVILQSVLKEIAAVSDSFALRKTIQQLGKVSKEVQDLSMSLRMVPIKPVFQKMQRIVRDTSQALGKEVSLLLTGEETELDKTVLERISDPLVHLVRNSVDHGIEASDLRISRGKSARGSVRLSAFQRSGRLVLEVADDGGGLDPEKLKKKALEKGLLKAGAVLTEREAYNLIFAPGFSTKEQVTDVSGRGVGMDVVKTNIHDLGGEVTIESKLGEGTVFRITLPLSLSIIDAMVVTYSNGRFVIPLTHVHESLSVKENQIQKASGLGEILLLRGESMPLIRLGDFFGLKSQLLPTQMIAMVIRIGSTPFSILVDDIIGQYQVVTKQLSPDLSHIKGISGTTILGDGRPALILEPLELLKRPLQSGYTKPQSAAGKVA